MAEGGDEVSRLHDALFRYAAFAEHTPPEERLLLFGGLPKLGDLVLIVEGRVARLTLFDEEHAPLHRVKIVAVVRLAATALVLLAAVC
jgi:hypothetical protein